ncbi:SAM-dependent methyltransferase [Pontiellaceae bacterium B12219]|nr:SAM-dependent methyltransferase [Pontiellaceae bacterium B12219]
MNSDTVKNLFICQPGFEDLLGPELQNHGFQLLESRRGWVLTEGPDEDAPLCFAHLQLKGGKTVTAESINALAGQLLDLFLEQIKGKKLPDNWPLIFRFADGEKGLGQRVKSVEKEFRARLKKRMARLARTASADLPRGCGNVEGFFIFFTDFNSAYATSKLWNGGQRRMADDPAAPSRSYLKTEEAFVVMGREPVAGETVVDLGAAPGGWSYSAAKRGASVVGIDNGPMKGGALDHPLIEHRRDDAFKFMPASGETYDWLFCDLVEDPHHVMRLIEEWFENRHCRHFVINLKFGRADANSLLRKVLDPDGRLARHCSQLSVRHLFHDRDEFTLTGSIREA